VILAGLSGFATWSLAEYLIHRFVLHRRKGMFWPDHMLHHREPLAEVGVPFYVTVPAGIASTLAAYFLVGTPAAAFALAFMLGYLAYVAMHEGLHRLNIKPGHPLYGAMRRHDAHHQGFPANYGVTSPLWDIVFWTYRN
jgi:dihydroceramide fatty acyl 2-hydroxylase